jgi:hypothetical protein
MSYILIILSNLIWALYALSEGLKDGTYEFYRDHSKVIANFNYKKMSFIQRLLVLSATSSLLAIGLGWLSIFFILCQIVLFKYFYFISYECSLRKVHNKNKACIISLLNIKKNKIKFLNEK